MVDGVEVERLVVAGVASEDFTSPLSGEVVHEADAGRNLRGQFQCDAVVRAVQRLRVVADSRIDGDIFQDVPAVLKEQPAVQAARPPVPPVGEHRLPRPGEISVMVPYQYVLARVGIEHLEVL